MTQLAAPKRERAFVGAHIDPAQLDQVQELARRSDRSVSAVVRRALAEHIAGQQRTDREHPMTMTAPVGAERRGPAPTRTDQ
jgi:hypothetical protein